MNLFRKKEPISEFINRRRLHYMKEEGYGLYGARAAATREAIDVYTKQAKTVKELKEVILLLNHNTVFAT